MIHKTKQPTELIQSHFTGVPQINYNGQDASNIETIKDVLGNALVSKHGDAANFIKSGVERDEPVIKRPQPTGDEEDDAAAIVRYYKSLERRDVRIEERLEKYPMIYADIMLCLSKESNVVIREHGEFAEIDRQSNPVGLWKLIIVTHTFKDKEDVVETKAAAWDGYYLMRMNEKDDSLFEFKKRTDNALAAITSAGEALPSDELQAQNFNNRLCSKYGALRLSYKNKLKDKPATLAQAYKLASEHRVLSRGGDTVTVNHLEQATVFVTTSGSNKKDSDTSRTTSGSNKKDSDTSSTESDGSGRRSVDKKKKEKKKKKKPSEQPDDKSGEAGDDKEKRPGREDQDFAWRERNKAWRDCVLCGDVKDKADRKHWPSDCPRLPQFQDLVKDGVINAAFGVVEYDYGAVCL
jgi:hypothetical protein